MVGRYIEALKELVIGHFAKYKVRIYLFGSYARGKARQSSDVDVAILPLEPLPEWVFTELREKLEEGTIPYRVDLVDLSTVDDEFKKVIFAEAILWKD